MKNLQANKESIVKAVRQAIVNQLDKNYHEIAKEWGISHSTVCKLAGVIKRESGFSRLKGRPLGTSPEVK
jgi:hypothetical protein